jgi:hypothetical protein
MGDGSMLKPVQERHTTKTVHVELLLAVECMYYGIWNFKNPHARTPVRPPSGDNRTGITNRPSSSAPTGPCTSK